MKNNPSISTENSVLDTTVSRFQSYFTNAKPTPVNLRDWLTSPQYQAEVERIRQESDPETRMYLTLALPAISPHALLASCLPEDLLRHSGLVAFGVDLADNPQFKNLEALKASICRFSQVAYCGRTITGRELWGLVPVCYPGKLQQHFEYFCDRLLEAGIEADRHPRKVAARLVYSYDSEAYFNHEAQRLEQWAAPAGVRHSSYTGIKTKEEESVKALVDQLHYGGVAIAPTRDAWIKVGQALASEFGEAGRTYFHFISMVRRRYDRYKTEKLYTECVRNRERSGVTIEYFFQLCEQAELAQPPSFLLSLPY